MRRRRYQRGFLLNPYRFEGTVQEGGASITSGATATFAGAAVASAVATVQAEASFIVETDQAASGAISVAGESVVTMAGASIAAGAASGIAEAGLTMYADAGAIVCDAADFDGTNDYLQRTSIFTGQGTVTSGILSIWFKIDGFGDNSRITLFEMDDDVGFIIEYFRLSVTSSGAVDMESDDSQGFIASSTALGIGTTNWHHILLAWNQSTSTFELYLDGISKTSDFTVSWTGGSGSRLGSADLIYVGRDRSAGGDDREDGGIAEFYFAPGQFLDITVETNREKFRVGDRPADMGATGSTPTGSVPLIYLHLDDGESANNFAINRSGNGNFTVGGSLTTYASSPSD